MKRISHHAVRVLTVAACLLAGSGVFAHNFAASSMLVRHPWAAPAEKGATTRVYLELRNEGDEPDMLVGASTTPGISKSVTLLRGEKKLDALAVPAGEDVRLADGAASIELGDLGIGLTRGLRFPLFLEFRRAGRVEVEIWVEEPGEQAGHPDAKH